MIELNLLKLREHLQFRKESGKRYVFDAVRPKVADRRAGRIGSTIANLLPDFGKGL